MERTLVQKIDISVFRNTTNTSDRYNQCPRTLERLNNRPVPNLHWPAVIITKYKGQMSYKTSVTPDALSTTYQCLSQAPNIQFHTSAICLIRICEQQFPTSKSAHMSSEALWYIDQNWHLIAVKDG